MPSSTMVGCERCAAVYHRLELLHDKVAALLPLPAAAQVEPGLLERGERPLFNSQMFDGSSLGLEENSRVPQISSKRARRPVSCSSSRSG